jgi:predicted CxxxxCH...CXXCH cytochrome family protein
VIRTRLFPPSLFALVILAGACAAIRDNPHGGGVHALGFADKDSPDFHGSYLKEQYRQYGRFPLAECRKCHGDDYGGGVVGTSCNQASCHTKGVEFCGTCHEGNSAPPKPTSGSHAAHKQGCENCHQVPKNARETQHPDGKIEVYLSGLAAEGGLNARWDADQRRCVSTYCHGGPSPLWESPQAPLPCDTCHAAPPASHARFPVGKPPEGCTPCHPSHDSPQHLDGHLDFLEPSCNTCHGKDATGAPPPALDGSTAVTSRGVGAHQSHLDPDFPGRIGKTLECDTCHEVPTSALDKGHIDTTAPADVRLFQGSYDPDKARCVVSCHWDKDPGPLWNDASGDAKKCDACHGFPPVKTRQDIPHPQVEPKIEVCQTCHLFTVPTHVDGHVDFLP